MSIILDGTNGITATVGESSFADLTATGDLTGFAGRLIAIQKYDTAGSYTYTPTAGTARIIVEIVGAGGGGGGADGDTTDQHIGIGGGGGGGGYVKVYANATASTYAVVVGAGGAGGTQSTNGSSGDSSTFTSNGDSGAALSITATGGDGGESTADRSDADISPGGNGGGFNFAGSSILFVLGSEGSSGGHGWAIPSDELVGSGIAFGGDGGFNQLCEMEAGTWVEVDDESKAGVNGNKFGAGGTGAAALGNTVTQSGGDGAPGGVIIYEYSE